MSDAPGELFELRGARLEELRIRPIGGATSACPQMDAEAPKIVRTASFEKRALSMDEARVMAIRPTPSYHDEKVGAQSTSSAAHDCAS